MENAPLGRSCRESRSAREFELESRETTKVLRTTWEGVGWLVGMRRL
jgi:hypothetical protein